MYDDRKTANVRMDKSDEAGLSTVLAEMLQENCCEKTFARPFSLGESLAPQCNEGPFTMPQPPGLKKLSINASHIRSNASLL